MVRTKLQARRFIPHTASVESSSIFYEAEQINPVTETVERENDEECERENEEEVQADDVGENIDEGDNVGENNGLGVDEEVCGDFGAHFGDIAGEEENVTDNDSGDEVLNDDKNPDPLSDDSDEEAAEERDEIANTLDSEEYLALGKTFDCASDFKLALLRYSLKTRYDIKLYKSSTSQIGAKCSDIQSSNCPWKIYGSYEKRKHRLQVKIYINEHTCIRSGYSSMLKRSSIALMFEERLRLNPKFTKKEMADEIRREYNLIVTEEQCSKAKSKLSRERKASHEKKFSRIWDYQAEVLRTNKYSTMEIETIPGPTPGSKQRFHRLYMCFTSQRESWLESCRPIIGLDGAFLKWDIKGHLLAAVGRDDDNRIVPIAWAVVEVENNDNWEWFVKLMKDDLRLGDGRNFTIMSYKQKGLVNAVKNELPEAEHRMCARHILANWKRDSKDPELERLFWIIAKVYTEGEYQIALQELKNYNAGAYESLMLQNPHTWSRAFFRLGSFCNDTLNNLSESFNKTIREARKKPITDLLEDIRRQCMVRNCKRAILASRSKTRFTRRAHTEIELTKERSKDCQRFMACGNLHEVVYKDVAYSVDMEKRTCGCVKWQLTGIPCIHASRVIMDLKLRFEDYVSEFYTSKQWQLTYSRGIKPVQGEPLWPFLGRLGVLPPPLRPRKRGRPSNYERRKGLNESSSSSNKTRLTRDKRVITCSNRRQDGHNKKGCSNQRVEPQPKRARGRPRKNDFELTGAQWLSQGTSQGQSQGPPQGPLERAHGGSQGASHGQSQGPPQGPPQGPSQRAHGGSQGASQV